MYTGFTHLHSALRYVVLIMLIYSVFKAYTAYSNGQAYSKSNDKLFVITMILVHTQLLIGLFMFFMSPTVQTALADMGAAMKDKTLRFVTVEHTLGMLIAIALITIGRIKSKKKATDTAKYKTIFTYYGLGLLIILLSIPWPFRGLGYGWF